MKHLSVAAGALLMMSGMAAAAISNWDLPNDQPYAPSDSIQFSYSADNDTAVITIYLETAEASSGLDTAEDGLLFTIVQIDNNTDERWGNDKGLMADRDPADGDFIFSPGRTGLPPALYHIRISDGDGSAVDTFRVVPLSDPYRTVSGTVTPPAGEDAAYIMVEIEAKDMEYSLSAFTDNSGDYSIGIDQATVEAGDGNLRVSVSGDFEGFIADPMEQEVDVSTGDKSGVDFAFVEASCSVSGTVVAGTAGMSDVRVVLTTQEYRQVVVATTDENGDYTLYGVPGTYYVRLEIGEAQGYLLPKEVKVELGDGDEKTVDFNLPEADGFIYGRVTVKGDAPSSMKFAVSAWNDSIGGNWAETDENGFFSIPVAAGAGKYGVSLDNRDDYPIPEGYIVENGQNRVETEVGDSAFFNLIDKPAGGISGTIENTTGLEAARYFIRVYGSDQQGGSYQFETTSDGSYTFDGIPEGTYYAEAGMSVAGEDEWQWKARLQYSDGSGQMKQLIIGGTVVDGIDWKFTAADTGTGGTGEQQKGDGTLLVTVTDETGTTFEKGIVMLFENIPGPDTREMPVATYQIDKTGEPVAFGEIPNKKLYVGVELNGKDGDNYRRFVAFAMKSDGTPEEFDFSTTDTLEASVTVTVEDSISGDQGTVDPVGNGKVSGTVTYTGDLPTDNLFVLLYDEEREDFVRGVSPSENGAYVIDSIAPGTYRVAAVIDTGDDKQPEAMTIGDESLVFTDDESYKNVDITLADKPTGSGGISGTVTSTFTLPEHSTVIVAAIPIDTTEADSSQLNQAALLMSYHVTMAEPGNYTIEDLPDGVYYVVVVAEVADSAAKDSHQVGFGVHGVLLADLTAEFPFDPTAVIVADDNVTAGIDIAMIPNSDDIPVRYERAAVPAVFSMSTPVINRGNGALVLQFALPEKTLVGFRVFDLTGKVVARRAPEPYPAGVHSVMWRMFASGSRVAANGTYILQLEGNRYTARQLLRIIR